MNETCSCGRPRERGQFCRHCHPELPRVMINRRNPRVVATACLTCGQSQISCQAGREYDRHTCCMSCDHD